jgi:hypothetical protein
MTFKKFGRATFIDTDDIRLIRFNIDDNDLCKIRTDFNATPSTLLSMYMVYYTKKFDNEEDIQSIHIDYLNKSMDYRN